MRKYDEGKTIGTAPLTLVAALFAVLCLIGPTAGAVTEITLWHDWIGPQDSRPNEDIIVELVERFEAENPDIVVNVDMVTSLNEKLLVAMMGGVAPDVVLLDRWMTSSFAAQGALRNLDPFIERYGMERDAFFPATWDEATFRGSSYGIPFNTDSRALWYHEGIFLESGLDPNAPPSTWEELQEHATKVTRRSGSGELERVGYVPHWGHGGFVHYLWQNGGTIFNEDQTFVLFDGPEGEESLEWMLDFVEWYGGIGALDAFDGTILHQGPLPALRGGYQAIIYEGNWNIGLFRRDFPDFYEHDLRAALPPMNKVRATLSGGFSFSIPSTTDDEKAEAAWRLIEYLTYNEETQLHLGVSTGVIPVLRAAATDPEYMDDEIRQVFIQAMEYTHFRPNHPVYPRMEAILRDVMQPAVLRREMSPRAALEDAARQAQSMLDEVNRYLERYEK